MFLCKNWHSVPEGRASNPGEESVVPLVTSQRTLVRTCFLTNRAAGNPVLLEMSLKGTFFFCTQSLFLNRWSRDICVFTPRLHLNVLYSFLRAFRSLSRIIPLLPLLRKPPTHCSLRQWAQRSPPTISEWTTRTCATRGWCLAGRSWQKSSSVVRPYALTHSMQRECRLIFLLGGRGEVSEVGAKTKTGFLRGIAGIETAWEERSHRPCTVRHGQGARTAPRSSTHDQSCGHFSFFLNWTS